MNENLEKIGLLLLVVGFLIFFLAGKSAFSIIVSLPIGLGIAFIIYARGKKKDCSEQDGHTADISKTTE